MTTRSDALLEAVAQAWVDRDGDAEDFRVLSGELCKRIARKWDELANTSARDAQDEAMIDRLMEEAR